MLKILLPIDGSENSDKAIVEFMKLLNWYKEMPEIHLLTVQVPLSGNISSYISATDIKQYHQEEGLKASKIPANCSIKQGLLTSIILRWETQQK